MKAENGGEQSARSAERRGKGDSQPELGTACLINSYGPGVTTILVPGFDDSNGGVLWFQKERRGETRSKTSCPPKGGYHFSGRRPSIKVDRKVPQRSILWRCVDQDCCGYHTNACAFVEGALFLSPKDLELKG